MMHSAPNVTIDGQASAKLFDLCLMLGTNRYNRHTSVSTAFELRVRKINSRRAIAAAQLGPQKGHTQGPPFHWKRRRKRAITGPVVHQERGGNYATIKYCQSSTTTIGE